MLKIFFELTLWFKNDLDNKNIAFCMWLSYVLLKHVVVVKNTMFHGPLGLHKTLIEFHKTLRMKKSSFRINTFSITTALFLEIFLN